ALRFPTPGRRVGVRLRLDLGRGRRGHGSERVDGQHTPAPGPQAASGRARERGAMTNRGWHDVRTHIDQVPPVEMAEVVELADGRAGPGGTRAARQGRRWVLFGVAMTVVALAAVVIVVSRGRTHDTSTTAVGGQVAAEEATYTIARAQLISNALVVGDEL